LEPQLSTHKPIRKAVRIGKKALALIVPNPLRSQRLKASVEKVVKFRDKAQAELDIEAFRYRELHSQVTEKPKKNVKDYQRPTKAYVISNKDMVGLRKQREAKERRKQERGKQAKKGKEDSRSSLILGNQRR
jgi:hypothetical protein